MVGICEFGPSLIYKFRVSQGYNVISCLKTNDKTHEKSGKTELRGFLEDDKRK